jgi:hypothetical protein
MTGKKDQNSCYDGIQNEEGSFKLCGAKYRSGVFNFAIL